MLGQKVPDSSGVRTLAARAHSATNCVCFNLAVYVFSIWFIESVESILQTFMRANLLRASFGFVVLSPGRNV